jgi:putative radical SAM enzyme (TIGR03279 family)
MKIQAVEPDSIADEIGLQPGDRLMNINGARVRDSLDYHFWSQEEELELDVMQANGDRVLIDVEKDPEEDLGLDLIEPPFQACANKCIFCFIHQNPSGMRKAVYFQDEDVRLSFLFGNYVTLAFATDAYLDRIIIQRLSPIFVSVHATDPELRRMMLGSPKAKDVMPILHKLADAEILIETQIVLCPGVNDGAALRQTVDDLAALFPIVESISIVPVGLSMHREGLYPLNPVTVDYAREMIQTVTAWQAHMRTELGRPLVYLSDEWYLMTDTPFPSEEEYQDCPVIENGVGMVSAFIASMERQVQELPDRLEAPLRLTLVTAALAGDVVREHLAEPLNQIENFEVDLVVVQNQFFGPGVTVSGLLVGGDIVRALEGQSQADLVYLPPNVLNDDGLFLDDMTLVAVSEAVGTEVRLFPERVSDVLMCEILTVE